MYIEGEGNAASKDVLVAKCVLEVILEIAAHDHWYVYAGYVLDHIYLHTAIVEQGSGAAVIDVRCSIGYEAGIEEQAYGPLAQRQVGLQVYGCQPVVAAVYIIKGRYFKAALLHRYLLCTKAAIGIAAFVGAVI